MAIFGYTWKLRIMIIVQNIILIAVFVGLGWYFDERLGTKPLLIAIAVIVSFIVNQLVSIQLIKRYTKDKPQMTEQDWASVQENKEEEKEDEDKSGLIM